MSAIDDSTAPDAKEAVEAGSSGRETQTLGLSRLRRVELETLYRVS